MREDSLILKYRKAMKQKSNATIEEKNKICRISGHEYG